MVGRYRPVLPFVLLLLTSASAAAAREPVTLDRDVLHGRAKACHIKKPDPTPQSMDQDNLTDPDSRADAPQQAQSLRTSYNAQAAVDADGSQLVSSAHVTQCASDRNELVSAVEGIPESVGRPTTAT